MAKPWTLDRLQALSQVQLETLYQNANSRDTDEAREIISLMLEHELLARVGGGLPRWHPIIRQIETICRSPEGVSAAIEAARDGEAALAGVDPLLQDAVGPVYGNYDTTGWAGGFVVEEMEAAGWVRRGSKALPSTCVAKRAMLFVAKEPA